MTTEEPLVSSQCPGSGRANARLERSHLADEQERRTMGDHIFRSRQTGHVCSASSSFNGVSFGLILYHAFSIRPLASMRNALRSIPMYVRPYIDFCFHTEYASASWWSTSASSG